MKTLIWKAAVAALLLFSAGSIAHAQQSHPVSGTIVDERGVPMAGVIVMVKGSDSGTVSDESGRYSIKAASCDIIIFSVLGFVTKEETVGSRSVINVKMAEDKLMLDEVVVV
jgi:hypothetical protein